MMQSCIFSIITPLQYDDHMILQKSLFADLLLNKEFFGLEIFCNIIKAFTVTSDQ